MESFLCSMTCTNLFIFRFKYTCDVCVGFPIDSKLLISVGFSPVRNAYVI